MNRWMWAVSLVGILSTAVVWGTDMFFLTIGRPALRLATVSGATEVMGLAAGHSRIERQIRGAAGGVRFGLGKPASGRRRKIALIIVS